jgi:flagellar hook assembly protein FlgD
MRIEFSLTRAAVVQVTVLASGALVKTLVPDRALDAGKITTIWNGTRADGSPAPDRTYRIRIAATAGDQQVVRIVRVAVDRTLGSLAASPGVFSPNGDGRVDQIAFGFELARPADVRVHVLRGTTIVKRLFAAAVGAAGHQEVVWDGRLADGSHAPSRAYRVRVQATTSLGTRVLERSFALDTIPPVLRVLSARTGAGVTRLRLVLSEPVRLRIWYGTNAWSDGDSISVERDAGEQVVSRRVRAGSIRVRAWDPAGNRSRAVIRRLG